MRNGVRARTRRTASRNMSICVTNRSERGVAQIHCKEEGSARNPIAAIIGHTVSMPELSERRKALRFSALRLLTQILCPIAPKNGVFGEVIRSASSAPPAGQTPPASVSPSRPARPFYNDFAGAFRNGAYAAKAGFPRASVAYQM